jgi:hypothetical protein
LASLYGLRRKPMAVALGFFALRFQGRTQLEDFVGIWSGSGRGGIRNGFMLLLIQAPVCNPQRMELDLAPKRPKVICRQLAATVVLVKKRKDFPGRIRRRIAIRRQLTQEYLWRAIAIQKGIEKVLETGIHGTCRLRILRSQGWESMLSPSHDLAKSPGRSPADY